LILTWERPTQRTTKVISTLRGAERERRENLWRGVGGKVDERICRRMSQPEGDRSLAGSKIWLSRREVNNDGGRGSVDDLEKRREEITGPQLVLLIFSIRRYSATLQGKTGSQGDLRTRRKDPTKGERRRDPIENERIIEHVKGKRGQNTTLATTEALTYG